MGSRTDSDQLYAHFLLRNTSCNVSKALAGFPTSINSTNERLDNTAPYAETNLTYRLLVSKHFPVSDRISPLQLIYCYAILEIVILIIFIYAIAEIDLLHHQNVTAEIRIAWILLK